MTGVEAVSNGVRAFRETTAQIAQRTLAVIIVCLALMLGGIAYLVRAYTIVATDPNGDRYQSVLSMLFEAVAGRGWFYYLAIGSVLLILIFSANTAFADFPRVCKAIAQDRFLPLAFASRGRRLVYSQGIWVLTILTAALLIGFGGVTDRLIPLYAVGAFLAFTLSQAGMLEHWRRSSGSGARGKILVNGLGALATGATVIVVIVAKFTEGAWITVIAIPAILALMYGVQHHYANIYRQIACTDPLDLADNEEPIVVVPLQQRSKIAQHALCAAFAISKELRVVYVASGDQSDTFCENWNRNVVSPARRTGAKEPELVILESPYRFVVNPIVDYVPNLSEQNPERRVIVMISELVERRWYNYFLHSQRATLLKTTLLLKGTDNISVLNVPWYFK